MLKELWMQWSQQTVELQTLRADKESIVTIWEELLDDFFSLTESHLGAVRRLVERIDDDQLNTQLQFELYEQEHWKQEVGKQATTITISDEEQLEEGPTKTQNEQQLKEAGAETKQPEQDRAGEPEHQQPKSDRDGEPKQQQQQNETSLDPSEQSILDILDGE